MRFRLFILFIGLAIAGSLAGVAAPAQSDGVPAAETAGVREIDLDGLKKLIQRDPKDTRPLLINFWATWCDSCREEFPDLVKIDADYRAKGLNFVAGFPFPHARKQNESHGGFPSTESTSA